MAATKENILLVEYMEDEASVEYIKFVVAGESGLVIVSSHNDGYPGMFEYSDSAMPIEQARELYGKLLAEGWRKPGQARAA